MKLQRSTKLASERRFMANKKIFVLRKQPKRYNGASVLEVQEEFEAKLKELAEFIRTWKNLKIYNGLEDGRVVSLKSEPKITRALIDEFSWVSGKDHNRATGDIYITLSSGHCFPVNVKLIADNEAPSTPNNMCGTVSKVSELLFGRVFRGVDVLCSKMAAGEHFTTEPQQYGFLMITKTTTRVKVCTLFNIKDLYVNPTNGFQFVFDEVETVKRTQREGQEFLRAKFEEYVEKRAKGWRILTGMEPGGI